LFAGLKDRKKKTARRLGLWRFSGIRIYYDKSDPSASGRGYPKKKSAVQRVMDQLGFS